MLHILVRRVSAPMFMANWADCGTVISVHMHLLTVIAIYLFINDNTITNNIIIMYELSNFDHVLGVVSQTRVSGGNRTHDSHDNGTVFFFLCFLNILIFLIKYRWQPCHSRSCYIC